MTVYADVLVAVNYIVNLLLLKITARLMGAICSQKRLYLAALLGAVGSLAIFLPDYGFLPQTLYKFALTISMAATAFGVHNRAKLFKSLLVSLFVSFLFAGVAAAAVFFLSPTGLLYYNGVVYFDLDVVQLILWIAAAYLMLTLLERFLSARVPDERLYPLTIRMEGESVTLKGFGDTGHSLKEPFSGAPVIICSGSFLAPLKQPPIERVRIIPCATVTGGGVLEAFRPDEIEISFGDGSSLRMSDVYVAAIQKSISCDYQALIPPALLNKKHYSPQIASK